MASIKPVQNRLSIKVTDAKTAQRRDGRQINRRENVDVKNKPSVILKSILLNDHILAYLLSVATVCSNVSESMIITLKQK